MNVTAGTATAFAAIVIGALSLAACGGHVRDEAAAVPEPACDGVDGVPGSFDCWREITGRPGCHVFDSYDSGRGLSWSGQPSVTWSGPCSGGVATGEGELIWKGGYKAGSGLVWSVSGTGELRQGVQHGLWVVRLSYERADGKSALDGLAADAAEGTLPLWPHPGGEQIMKGSFEDGRRHGDWFYRYDSGTCVRREHDRGEVVDNQFCAAEDEDLLQFLFLRY